MSIKISAETLNILKNFSGINNSIVLKKNQPLMTISKAENIFAMAEIQESFPHDIGIYDLSEFLGTIGLFQTPVLDFNKDDQSYYTDIHEENGKSSVKYRFDDVSLITSPDDVYDIASVEIEFTLMSTDIQKIMKASAILSLDDIAIVSDGEKVSMVARSSKNKLSNTYELELPVAGTGAKFEFIVKAENMKMILGEYKVQCSKEGSIMFKSANGNLSYLIALDNTSTYSE